MKLFHRTKYRETAQPILPKHHEPTAPGEYDIYSAYPLSEGKIEHGFIQLASHLSGHPLILIDGYFGVLWDHFQTQLDQALQSLGVHASWISIEQALRPARGIDMLIEPFLGGNDPIFGKRFTGTLTDFFKARFLTPKTHHGQSQMTIYYGTFDAGRRHIHPFGNMQWEEATLQLCRDLPRPRCSGLLSTDQREYRCGKGGESLS